MTQVSTATAIPIDAPEEAGDQVFDSYEEAVKAATGAPGRQGIVKKIERSRYGRGYVVRSAPVTVFVDPDLRRAVFHPLKYEDL